VRAYENNSYTKWRNQKEAHCPTGISIWSGAQELIKTIPGADWQPKLKAWSIPYSDEVISNLISLVNRNAWLDYSAFKKVAITTQEKVTLPKMDAGIAQEIEKFTDWMRNRRLSRIHHPKTICIAWDYFWGLREIRTQQKSAMRDLENFHKDYILKITTQHLFNHL